MTTRLDVSSTGKLTPAVEKPVIFSSPGWQPLIPILAAAILSSGLVILIHASAQELATEGTAGVLLLVLAVAYFMWAVRQPTPTMPILVGVGALVQIVAVAYYYYTGFSSDANQYHRAALEILNPDQELDGRFSLQRSEWANWMMAHQTASIYRVLGESQLAAFVVFAGLGVLAKAIFASCLLRMRHIFGRAADVTALGVMVYPSFALWLSAISKEMSAVLGLSLVLAGVVRPLGKRPSVALIGLGVVIAGSTRPHVAAMVAGSLVVFAAVSAAFVSQSMARRISILVCAGAFGFGAILAAASFFDVEPTAAGFESVRDDVAPTTAQGDSDIEPSPINTPADIPAATANVLIRPFLFEATGVTSLLQAAETTLLLGLVGFAAFSRRRRRANRLGGAARRHVQALRAFALTYVAVFVYSFSGMYNLGLMSRQRIQVTLFVLLFLSMSMVSTRRRARRHRTTSPPLVNRLISDAIPAPSRANGGPLLTTRPPTEAP